jgi:hypothetical protein
MGSVSMKSAEGFSTLVHDFKGSIRVHRLIFDEFLNGLETKNDTCAEVAADMTKQLQKSSEIWQKILEATKVLD